MWLWILIGLSIITKVHGFSDGRVPESCQTMLPNHETVPGGGNLPPQNGVPPFDIEFGEVINGAPLTVNLKSSTSQFKGFMLEARKKVNGSPAGKFILLDTSGTQLLPCASTGGQSYEAVTQTTNSGKHSIQVNWTAEGKEVDTITFRVTFIQSFSRFWRPVEKDVLLPTTSTPPTTSTQSSTITSTTVPTTREAKTTSPPVPSPTNATEASGSTVTSATNPSSTISTTVSATTEAKTTSPPVPSPTNTTKASSSTVTSATNPSSTTSTTLPSATSTAKPGTTVPNTTSTAKAHTTRTTTVTSSANTAKPSTKTNSTVPTTTNPSSTICTTMRSATNAANPSSTTSTSVPSATSTAKSSQVTNLSQNTKAGTVLMAIDLFMNTVKTEHYFVVIATVTNNPFSHCQIKISNILFCVLCAAFEISRLVLICMDDPIEVTLVALVCVVIVINIAELLIYCLPIEASHELNDICHHTARACSVIHMIFSYAVIFVDVLKTEDSRKSRKESWLVIVVIAYAVCILLSVIRTFVLSIYGDRIPGTNETGTSERSSRQAELNAGQKCVIAVSVILLLGALLFTVAVIVGVCGWQEK